MNDYISNLVTVDVDNDKITSFERLVLHLRLRQICTRYKCVVHETENGLHVYIWLDRKIPFWNQISMRAYLYDDPDRLEFDIIRYYRKLYTYLNTLFIVKKDGSYVSKEKKVFLS